MKAMPQRQHATKHPAWMRLAIRLAVWVAPVLVTPLLLGILLDTSTPTAPWGLLCGLTTGITLGALIIIRTIHAQFQALAPDPEDAKERS